MDERRCSSDESSTMSCNGVGGRVQRAYKSRVHCKAQAPRRARRGATVSAVSAAARRWPPVCFAKAHLNRVANGPEERPPRRFADQGWLACRSRAGGHAFRAPRRSAHDDGSWPAGAPRTDASLDDAADDACGSARAVDTEREEGRAQECRCKLLAVLDKVVEAGPDRRACARGVVPTGPWLASMSIVIWGLSRAASERRCVDPWTYRPREWSPGPSRVLRQP